MKIVVDGQLLNYADSGTGDVILFLHGWGMSLTTFDAMSKELEKNYRVIRLDFPGFGASSLPPKNWSNDDYAKITVAFLKKIKINNIHTAITHSFGGRIIIKMMGMQYFEPEKLVLIGSGGIKHSDSLKNQAFKFAAKAGKQIAKLPVIKKSHNRLRQKLYEKAGSVDYINAGDLQQIFLRVINEDIRDLAAKIEQETLIVWGENDTETPVSDAKILHAKIANSKLVTIPNTGHFVYLEAHDRVMQEIRDFLK